MLQWQLFDAESGKYVVSPDQSPRAKKRGRAWRLCRPDRALKPKYPARQHVSRAGERSVQAIIREYCDWAAQRGLSITAFRGQWVPGCCPVVRRV
jgi:hypothetical protein